MSGRSELAIFILDERNTPMACLGAVVSYVRNNVKYGRRMADAIDATIKTEVRVIQAEAKPLTGD